MKEMRENRTWGTGVMRQVKGAVRAVFPLAVVLLPLVVTMAAQAQTHQFSVIYNFGGAAGEGPNGLIADSAGNLYGTTANGGDLSGCSGYGCGTVFELLASGGEAVIYNFTGGADGSTPGLTASFRDVAANVYGSTPYGGNMSSACETGGCGVIFEVGSTGREKVLYSFTGASDGWFPNSALLHDSAGNVYGLAAHGGNFTGFCGGYYGCGVVFKISKAGQETVLYTFSGGVDGAFPGPGLVRDRAGNLYGSTGAGGAHNWGAVFKVDSSGNETVLYSFTGGSDGGIPEYLVADADGNLYGTTLSGGNVACPGGCGVVFKIDPSGNETVLYTFTGGTDGYYPLGGLVRDTQGNLYSTTTEGGAGACCGVIFKLGLAGTETVLHIFTQADGQMPLGNLVVYNNYIYGTTSVGGSEFSGVAYKVRP
jgi:uncharacterized repeat protein (TIGR03803 family)